MAAGRSQQALLAEGLARQGHVAPAVDACYQALRNDDDDPLVHALLADLFLSGDFYDEAISAATRAIELDPACAPAFLALGLAYDRRGGMWDQSILVWHELAEVVPDLVTAHVQLGEAFSAAAFDTEAIEAWRAALELDPTEARAMYNLAVAALKREGMATALPGFRKAGELDPSQDDFFFSLAGVFDDGTPAPEAMAVALRSLAVSTRTPTAVYVLGAAFAKRPGLNRNSARVFGALAKAVPEHPMPHVLLAESLLSLQRYSQAKASYLRAVELDPTCVRARFGLAAVLLTEGEYSRAHWEIRRAGYHDTRRQGLFWQLYDEYAEGRS
jgi:tetratricopeptide (TPR) repeat protein